MKRFFQLIKFGNHLKNKKDEDEGYGYDDHQTYGVPGKK